MAGCIDGSYIKIRTPAHKKSSTYTNRHDQVSLTLQAVCDSEKRILDASTGYPGKIHDARVLELSKLSGKLEHLCGDEFHILGDSAYPLRQYIMTPFNSTYKKTPKIKKFNKSLSQGRVKIENCFSSLKSRFRQLTELHMFTVDKYSKFIIACCVLHNLCVDNNDFWAEEEFVEVEQDLYTPSSYESQKEIGEWKRILLLNNYRY